MFGQKSEAAATANIAQAVRVDRAPRLDGTLDDPVWQQAPAINDLVRGAYNQVRLHVPGRLILSDMNPGM